jgi:aspartate/methionine/tyrosine aminotransferase
MDSSFRWNDNDYVCVIPVKTGIHYKHKFTPLIPKEPQNLKESISMNSLNPLAIELNEAIKKNNEYLFSILSQFGLRIYFPKGILSQSAEAKVQAKKTNATIGIATEKGVPMYLSSIQKYISDISPKDSYDYAPAAGKPDLRSAWKKKMLADNPSLNGKSLSNPIVTNGLTHGLSITGDLFVNHGDTVIVADKVWDNYPLTFGTRYGAELEMYPLYNDKGGFNTVEFRKTLLKTAKYTNKILTILNFPNNPTGYTATIDEAREIADAIHETADSGCNVVVVCDDAYFGLFYDENTLKESISAYVAGIHPRVMTIKIDGASKEEYAWGFRIGFITFALGDPNGEDQIYTALERKVMGCIRTSISNCANLSQTLVLEAINSPSIDEEKTTKANILKARAMKVKEVLKNDKYIDAWAPYLFNSGYFMCIRLKSVDPEMLRLHLLKKYGVGVIAIGGQDIRVAFSSVEESDIEELFDTIYNGVKDLS